MKTLSHLQNEAIERFDKKFSSTDKDQTGWLVLRKAYLDFLKQELTNTVKESFKNTECGRLVLASPSDLEKAEVNGYNQALEEVNNKENQFLNN